MASASTPSYGDQMTALSTKIDKTRSKVNEKFIDVEQQVIDLRAKLDNEAKDLRTSDSAIASRLDGFIRDVKLLKEQATNLHDRVQKLESSSSSAGGGDSYAVKTLGGTRKPFTFNPDDSSHSFQDWAHKLKTYSNGIFKDSVKLLSWVSKQSSEIDQSAIPRDAHGECDISDFSSSLYTCCQGILMAKHCASSARKMTLLMGWRPTDVCATGSIQNLPSGDST